MISASRCVGRMFCRTWSRWPLAVAIDLGGWVCIDFVVRPGKSWRKFSATAFCKVVIAGEKREACANATSSGILVVAFTWFAW